ncbi:coiled-coil domain-containing protein 172-like [Haliotis cracherodii]|uniref:coiled-coil domain-containing protein 172-like n=1 Tax=Haliotis cracherodii TaxID=6455 RepID=UPI0039E9D0F7
MTATLHDLFDQIIHSERKAREKKNYLQEVKSKLSSLEEGLEESKDEHMRLKGQLLLKVQHWKQEELKRSFLTSRQAILLEQRQALEAESDHVRAQLKELQTELLNAMSEFSTEASLFSEDYDLLSSGSARREKEARARAEQLEEPVHKLTKELEKYEVRKSAAQTLEEELHQANHILEQTKVHLAGIEQKISAAQELVEELKTEKSQVAGLPLNGEEFKVIHQELEGLQSTQLEAKCMSLQTELSGLQQQLRLKAVQQQQQQQTQHEQQRCQQHYNYTYKPQPQDTIPPSCTSNRLCVSNFSHIVKENEVSVELKEEDFDDDMTLPDLDTNTPSADDVCRSKGEVGHQRRSIFRPRRI